MAGRAAAMCIKSDCGQIECNTTFGAGTVQSEAALIFWYQMQIVSPSVLLSQMRA